MNEKKESRRDFLSKMLTTGVGAVTLMSVSSYAKGPKGTNPGTLLTDEQKDKLFFIYQEEKVARDSYITLGNIYTDEQTFASTQLSEQRHMDSARELCIKYGVDVSEVDETKVGEFVLPLLQTLYDELMMSGEESLLDALKVGELIEIKDIKDLEEACIGMPDDVVSVYENLKEGSLNHLEAFQTAIART